MFPYLDPLKKTRLVTPGPTQIDERTRQAMDSPAEYHRSPEFSRLVKETRDLLSTLFGSELRPILLSSSGTGAMEASLACVTSEKDAILVVSGGKFGERWSQLGQSFGCHVTELRIPYGEAPTADQMLEKIKSKNFRAIFLQACETSTGCYFNIESLIPDLRKEYTGWIVVDAVSSLCAHPMKMEKWGIDVVLSGSQKGLGVHPGLSFVALSPRVLTSFSKRHRFYFDLGREYEDQEKGAPSFTPPTSLIRGLHASLTAIHEAGIDQVLDFHARVASGVREGIKKIGLATFCKSNFSNSVTSFRVPDGLDGKCLLKDLQDRYGFVFAGGQGELRGQIIRMAHLGFFDRFDCIESLAALEFVLHDHRYPMQLGSGVGAFMQHMAKAS